MAWYQIWSVCASPVTKFYDSFIIITTYITHKVLILTFQCSQGNLDIYESYNTLFTVNITMPQARNSYSSVCYTPSGARITSMFWWRVHRQAECIPDEPGRTHHFGHKLKNFENPICLAGYFNLKIECSSLRFARRSLFCLCIFHSCQC